MRLQLESLKSDDIIDIYNVALAMLQLLKDAKVDKFESIADLMSIINKQQFNDMLNVLGGKHIYIPTVDEMEDMLMALLIYSDSVDSNLSIDKLLSKRGVDTDRYNTIKLLLVSIKNSGLANSDYG